MTVHVLLTGTDPEEPMGGIGVAMAGYVRALQTVDVDFQFIPSYRPGVFGGRWWWPIRAAWRLIRATRILRAAGQVPIVYAHGGRGIGLLRQSLLLFVAQATGARSMLQLHSMSVDRYLQSRTGRTFLRLCLLPTNRVCVLTEWWASRLRRLDNLDTAVIPNPLPPALERVAGEMTPGRRPQEDVELRLLTMTRLVSGKGVDLAVRVMACLPSSFRLRIAGEGRERRHYERLATRLDLGQRVQFLGWVEAEEKPELYRKSDIFLLPTRNDSFGMAFVEAMAFGLPVVALRWGSIPHVVPDESAGILVENAEPCALAEAVLRLRDPSLRQSMGAFGRAWVLEQYNANAVGEKIRRAATRLAGRRTAR